MLVNFKCIAGAVVLALPLAACVAPYPGYGPEPYRDRVDNRYERRDAEQAWRAERREDRAERAEDRFYRNDRYGY